jgi:hypothetical protein
MLSTLLVLWCVTEWNSQLVRSLYFINDNLYKIMLTDADQRLQLADRRSLDGVHVSHAQHFKEVIIIDLEIIQSTIEELSRTGENPQLMTTCTD